LFGYQAVFCGEAHFGAGREVMTTTVVPTSLVEEKMGSKVNKQKIDAKQTRFGVASFLVCICEGLSASTRLHRMEDAF